MFGAPNMYPQNGPLMPGQPMPGQPMMMPPQQPQQPGQMAPPTQPQMMMQQQPYGQPMGMAPQPQAYRAPQLQPYQPPQVQFGQVPQQQLPGYPQGMLPGYPGQQPIMMQPQQQFMQMAPQQLPGYPMGGFPGQQQGYPMQQGVPMQMGALMQQYQQVPQQQRFQVGAQGAVPVQQGQPQGQPLQNTQDIMNCAQILRRAMKGLGTDEKAIIQVAKTHTWQQRAAIAESFCAQFGMTLDKELKKELSGNLERVLRGVFQDRYVFWAQQIDDAIRGAGTDEKRLIQLVLLMGDEDNKIVNEVYRKMFNRDMFTAIQNDISNNDWGRLLKAWMKGENTVNVDPQRAADELWAAAKGAGTDEDVFIRIICSTSPQTYRQVAQCFQQKFGKSLRDIIKREFSLRSEFAFLLAHDYLMDPAGACAFLINKAVKGAGTDDKSLVNVTVLYSDYFKGEAIKRAYVQFGDVTKALKGDLSGKYELAVLSLWGLE